MIQYGATTTKGSLQAFNLCLLQLARLSRGRDAAQFIGEGLQAFAQLVPFASAWWGEMSQAQASAAPQSWMHGQLNLSESFASEWNQIAARDRFSHGTLSRPGELVRASGFTDPCAEVNDFARRYDLYHLLCISFALPESGLMFFVCLYRGASAQAFTRLQQSGELTARAELALMLDPAEAAADPVKTIAAAKALANTYDQGEVQVSPGVQMRHVKLFMDGIINAPADTGALLTPYMKNVGTEKAPQWVPGDNLGELYYPAPVLKPLLLEALKAGFDPHLHATGERAVRESLDGIEYVRQQLPGHDFRPAIAHAETVATADYGRFKALDTTVTMSHQWAQQAPFSVDGTNDELGAERFARMEPSGSIAQAGGRVAYGSDWPVDPLDEMLALKIGVTRAGDPSNPHSYGPDLAGKLNDAPGLSRAEALRSITLNAAEQLRLNKVLGSIEVGKFADLIVLDKNFMQVPEEELARNQVLLTLVGGKVVFAQEQFSSLEPQALSQTALQQTAP